ncbi:MAG: hypothetical protein K6F57_01125 [Candidatus Saccharibacteria bacterium]|nr:hypothetical protein [Candidatus Saccharibacteria bacterium]
MLGSTLIDVVNEALQDTRDRIEDEMCLKYSVACVDVRGIVRDKSGRMKCGFSYSATIATGEAERDERYCAFLQEHLFTGHKSLLAEKKIPEVGWEASPIVLKRIDRKLKGDKSEYSIAVAALGGTREENETIVDAVISDIPEIG